jgi:hypothetical protein
MAVFFILICFINISVMALKSKYFKLWCYRNEVRSDYTSVFLNPSVFSAGADVPTVKNSACVPKKNCHGVP